MVRFRGCKGGSGQVQGLLACRSSGTGVAAVKVDLAVPADEGLRGLESDGLFQFLRRRRFLLGQLQRRSSSLVPTCKMRRAARL